MSSGYKELKEQAWELNMEIPRKGLAIYTWGNVSVFDREKSVYAIKPSGVSYDKLKPEDIVIVDLDSRVVEGRFKPSSDTNTHSVLYREFQNLGGIVHTHSTYAVGWSQASRDITIWGTTHADHLVQDIPCTEFMADDRIEGNYEEETGWQIVNCFRERNFSPAEVPMVLVAGHGPFTWGETAEKAVYNAVVLEELARMAFITQSLKPGQPPLKNSLKKKHFLRKHGPGAYYGQN